jgi:hypothetical protein
MYTGFCILSILWKQIEENIDVQILRIQNPVYMYIYVFFFLFPEKTENTEYMYNYVFFFLFPEKTENTEPSIHVHLCFLLSVSDRRKHRCTCILGSVFSVFSGNRKKKT